MSREPAFAKDGRRHVVAALVPGTVEAWSTTRLLFEPSGWLVDLRAELREAVRSLTDTAGPGHRLSATYTSLDQTHVDAENVLFYNVGTGCFGRPSVVGIHRRFAAPPPPPMALDGDGFHHHRYSVGAGVHSGAWTTRAVVARWDTGPLSASTTLASAAPIWAAVRAAVRAAPPAGILRLGPTEAFGIEVAVMAPDATRRSLPALTKALLDGCIAALHDHDGADGDEVASRVAVKACLDQGVVALLLRPIGAPLGTRRLVHRFGAGVQWNPADDLCASAILRLESAARYRITGRLLAIDAA